MIEKLFYFESQLQLKHWQEPNGYKHEILGRYYKDLTKLIDRFAEVYASTNKDITSTEYAFALTNHIDMVETYNQELRKFIAKLREQFDGLHALTNVLDDISTLIEQYNYLLIKN